MEAISSTLGMKLPRNYFDLSQIHVFTCKAGYIYPIFAEILFPGDLIKVRNQAVIRQMPTISPSFSRFKIKFWDFVVAIRNLDKDIYRFMSGYKEYTSEVKWNKPLPRWIPSNIEKTRPGTLWDFLQNPINCIPDEDSCQIDYLRQAYGYIYDIYFRNEARQESILIEGEPGSWTGEDLLQVNWDRDYITTSLPKQQMGDPSAIPLVGIGSAIYNGEPFNEIIDESSINLGKSGPEYPANINYNIGDNIFRTDIPTTGLKVKLPTEAKNRDKLKEYLNKNTIDFGTAGTILISQIRESIAIQCMNEINAIAGIRDQEFLDAHWGEAPSNEALQYPEIFGKEVCSLITSEIVQTSESTDKSALGEMGGHGLAVGEGNEHKFYSREFSIYLKLMYIKPETLYSKQGAKRKFTQKSIYDFPFPELNHISMQPVYARELLCASSKFPYSTDNGITLQAGDIDPTAEDWNAKEIGFVNNFQWYKENLNIISGLINAEQYYANAQGTGKILAQSNLSNWTEARIFSIKNEERPLINDSFLKCNPDKRNYNVTDEDQFVVWHKNIVNSWRTMSLKGMPSSLGMINGL